MCLCSHHNSFYRLIMLTAFLSCTRNSWFLYFALPFSLLFIVLFAAFLLILAEIPTPFAKTADVVSLNQVTPCRKRDISDIHSKDQAKSRMCQSVLKLMATPVLHTPFANKKGYLNLTRLDGKEWLEIDSFTLTQMHIFQKDFEVCPETFQIAASYEAAAFTASVDLLRQLIQNLSTFHKGIHMSSRLKPFSQL